MTDDALRQLVRELLSEALDKPAPDAPAGGIEVRIASDDDLRAFALRVLDLAEDPARRHALRAGTLRFSLAAGSAANGAPPPAGSAGNGAAIRIERGALTEKQVATAARDGSSIVLGKRAVATPLALDKARSLGVSVQKEAT